MSPFRAVKMIRCSNLVVSGSKLDLDGTYIGLKK